MEEVYDSERMILVASRVAVTDAQEQRMSADAYITYVTVKATFDRPSSIPSNYNANLTAPKCFMEGRETANSEYLIIIVDKEMQLTSGGGSSYSYECIIPHPGRRRQSYRGKVTAQWTVSGAVPDVPTFEMPPP